MSLTQSCTSSSIILVCERTRSVDGQRYISEGTICLKIRDTKLQLANDDNSNEFEFNVRFNTIDGKIATNIKDVHSITFSLDHKSTIERKITTELSEDVKLKYIDKIRQSKKEIEDSVEEILIGTNNLSETEETNLISYIDASYVTMRNHIKDLLKIRKYPVQSSVSSSVYSTSSVDYIEYEDSVHRYIFTLQCRTSQCLNELPRRNSDYTFRIYWAYSKDCMSNGIIEGAGRITKEFVSSTKERVVIPYEQK